MVKTLVVCYSRTETTLRVALDVANALGADLDRVETVTSRKGALGYALSAAEALAKGLPSIRTRRDPRSYDLVVLGSPVWVGTMCAPMRSYLFLHRGELPRVGLFATMGGHGADQVLQEMKMLCQADKAPARAFLESQVRAGAHRGDVDSFVAALCATTTKQDLSVDAA